MSRILIVDDKVENLYLLRVLLQGNGYEVDEARHGAEALVKARQTPPSLIVTDLLMPVMDGYTLLSHWKKDETLRQIPFVVYTATYTEPKDERLALDLGADAFIVKPAEPDVFVASLQEVLARHNKGNLPPSTPPEMEKVVLLKQYNEVLINRLESKMQELERTNRDLEQDIASRRRTENELREVEYRAAVAIDAARLGTFDWDLTSGRIVWNARHAELFGMTLEEFNGTFACFEQRVCPADLPALNIAIEECKRDRTLFHQEFRVVWPDGGLHWVASSGRFSYQAETNQPVRMHGVVADISERKQLESNFLRAQRMEGIGALASGIAHDLNNILTPVLLAAPVLRDSVADESSIEMLDTIEKCARRGVDIIKQLLTFARGKSETRVPVSIWHLMLEMEKIVRETFPRNITPRLFAPKDLWPVMGDSTQLHQVLMNLCVNARDAMPDGGALRIEANNVTLKETFAAIAQDAKPGPYVCVSVSDTGTGIAPENTDRVFDPFFTTKEIGKGTGLGLAAVQGIVRGHGGFVRLTSKLGEGTHFELFFPAAPEIDTPALENQELPIPRSHGELILVVDDEASMCASVRRALENQGYRVAIAGNGAEALDIFNRNRAEIRAVVTDMMMPVINGAALIHALRAVDPRLPILGMTGLAEEPGVKGLHDIESLAILTKPFTSVELARALYDAIQPRRHAMAQDCPI